MANGQQPQQEYTELPEGDIEDVPSVEQLSQFVAKQLLELSAEENPTMFSREDILGNIDRWEKMKLQRLHQLQKACNRMGLTKAKNFFIQEEKKILGISRSVQGFQQKILRTTLTGRDDFDKEQKKGFIPKWRWK